MQDSAGDKENIRNFKKMKNDYPTGNKTHLQ